MGDQFETKVDREEEAEAKSVLIFPRGKRKIPLFLEFLFTITRLVVIVSTVLVAVLSVIAKASLVDVAIRVGITTFSLGLLGTLINWLVGNQYLQSAVEEMKEIDQENRTNNNSIQFEA
jgi:hypothetical protein